MNPQKGTLRNPRDPLKDPIKGTTMGPMGPSPRSLRQVPCAPEKMEGPTGLSDTAKGFLYLKDHGT